MTRKQIEQAANRAGWNCTFERESGGKTWCVNFNTDTTHGQDVQYDYTVDSLNKIPELIQEDAADYDPDYEASLWIGSDGHGKNGAPHRMSDVLKDMEEVEKLLEDLSVELNKLK